MTRRRGLDAARVTDAAVMIADVEGLDAVTIARVAAALEVRPPSLYNHVSSRDELLVRVAARAVNELADALALAIAGRAGDDAVRALATAYRRWAAEHPGRYAASQRAPLEGQGDLAAASERVLALLRAALRGVPHEAADEIHLMRALRSALHGFVSLEAAGGFALPDDLDASFTALVDALLRGLATARG